MRADPTLLRPTNEAARRAVLCVDPAIAMAVAQAACERPLMFNHAHGLWGYVGTAADGEPLLVQATGTGGPSAALVLADLAGCGVQRAVHVGRAWGTRAAPGTFVAATSVLGADGTSRALGGARAVDPQLTEALAGRAGAASGLVSHDVPVREVPLADLEAAALVAAAARAGVRLAVGVVLGEDPEAHTAAGATAAEVLR